MKVNGTPVSETLSKFLQKAGVQADSDLSVEALQKVFNPDGDKILGDDDLKRLPGIGKSEFIAASDEARKLAPNLPQVTSLWTLGEPIEPVAGQETSTLVRQIILEDLRAKAAAANRSQAPQVASPRDRIINDSSLENLQSPGVAEHILKKLGRPPSLDNRQPIPDADVGGRESGGTFQGAEIKYDSSKKEIVFVQGLGSKGQRGGSLMFEQVVKGDSAKVIVTQLAELSKADQLLRVASNSDEIRKAIAQYDRVLQVTNNSNPLTIEKRIGLDAVRGQAKAYALLASKTTGTEREEALRKCKAAFVAIGNEDSWTGREFVPSIQAELVTAHKMLFPSEKLPFPLFYPRIQDVPESVQADVAAQWPKVN